MLFGFFVFTVLTVSFCSLSTCASNNETKFNDLNEDVMSIIFDEIEGEDFFALGQVNTRVYEAAGAYLSKRLILAEPEEEQNLVPLAFLSSLFSKIASTKKESLQTRDPYLWRARFMITKLIMMNAKMLKDVPEGVKKRLIDQFRNQDELFYQTADRLPNLPLQVKARIATRGGMVYVPVLFGFITFALLALGIFMLAQVDPMLLVQNAGLIMAVSGVLCWCGYRLPSWCVHLMLRAAHSDQLEHRYHGYNA